MGKKRDIKKTEGSNECVMSVLEVPVGFQWEVMKERKSSLVTRKYEIRVLYMRCFHHMRWSE